MRKILLNAALLALPTLGFSQIFQENFDGTGPGFSAWTLIDVDGQTHNAGVSDFDAGAWIRKDRGGATPNYGGPDGNYAAMSSSWYDPTGTSNDWLISPQITLPSTIAVLKWDAKAQDVNYPDGYKVMLSTNGGNTVADFTVQLYSTTGESSTWISREVSLAAYVGQTVRVAFVNNSNDKYVLLVDNIKVENAPTTPPSCPSITAPANGATNVAYQSLPITWTAPSGTSAASSYEVYLDKNTNPTTLVNTVTTTTYTATNLDPSSTYYLKVIAKNAAGSATGCTVYSFTTMAPTYCTAGATSTSFEKISNVTFANINKNSTATAGYEDFTSTIGNVTAGQTYTFTASFTGTSYNADHVLVWIDFNNDKDFNDAGEQVLVTATKKSPWTGSITIPAGATATTTRMRVRLNDSGSSTSNITPCGTSTFGQVEDYTLNIASLAVSDVNKADNIKAYPNPVKDVLKLEAAGTIKSVKVFDTAGKQIMTKELNEAKSQIDLSKLGTGVYVVTTTLADGTTTSTKVIKE